MMDQRNNITDAREFLALAKENGIEMSEAESEAAFEQFRKGAVELNDDDLDKVAGGSIWTWFKALWEGKL